MAGDLQVRDASALDHAGTRACTGAKFSHYEEVPRELADKVIAAAKAEKEAGAHA